MGEFTSALDWTRVLADAGAAALVMDQEGRILFINDAAARIYGKRPAGECRGQRLADLIRANAVEERLEVNRRVLGNGQSIVFVDLWAGVAMRGTVRRLDSFTGASGPVALWVYRHEESGMEPAVPGDGANVVEARQVDLGQLSNLTNSELKVMALLGEGLSNAEIAARLHRAVKTVESHRASLTEKTGSSSRVQLGVMARRAGLIRRVDIPHDGSSRGKSARAMAWE